MPMSVAVLNYRRAVALSGLAVPLAGVVFSFIPPDGVQAVWRFESKRVVSMGAVLTTAAWLDWRAARPTRPGPPAG
jgi:hypothetical protein